MNIIATNIVRRRKELKMTQKELAEKLHISDKTVSRWETGNQIPDALTIPEIAKVLDMTIDELYGNERKAGEPEQDSAPKDGEEVDETEDVGRKKKERSKTGKTTEEYPNLEYNKIMIFKVALIIGVFLSFVNATIVASNLIFVSVIWKLVCGFVFAGIILYFFIVEIVFREFYKRKELALYYERENVRWLGLALIGVNVIIALWIPFLQEVNGFLTISYAGVTITVVYNLILLVLGFLYRLRMKKQQFDITLSNWLIPGILFLMGMVMVIRYLSYASKTLVTTEMGWYNPLLYALNGLNRTGVYVDDRLRMLAVVTGMIFVFAQIVNYVLLLQVWKQKNWNRKREIRVVLALSLAFILLVVVTLVPYGRYTVYDMFSAKMENGRNQKFVIDTATIGIDFENHGGQFTYFKINTEEGIEELLDRLDKIRLDEGTIEDDQEGRKCFIHLQGKKMYKYGSSWSYGGDGASDADTYWQITLNEDGTAYYGEEYYEIKGRVDWNGLYELALSEYYGVNRDLYLKWLGLGQ